MVTVMGINHVALDVPDIDEAVEFYTYVFDAEVMKRSSQNAWLDMNGRFDFLALFEDQTVDRSHKAGHWGLVVDDLEAVRARAEEYDLEFNPQFECDFRDPFGYQVQVIRESDVSKAPVPYDVENQDFTGDL